MASVRMPRRRSPPSVAPWLALLAGVAACRGEGAGSRLRGSVDSPPAAAAPTPPASAPSAEEYAASCTCDAAGSCGCARSEPERGQSQDEEQADKTLLEHTQRLTAWWLAQSGSAHDTQLWSGPLPSSAAESIDLWVAAHGHASAVHVGGAAVHAGGAVVHGGGAVVHGGGAVVHGGAVVAGGGATACKGRAGCGCVGRAGC